MTIRVAVFTGDPRFTPRSARSRARSVRTAHSENRDHGINHPCRRCQAAISFPLAPRSVRATVRIPPHLLHATWLVPLVYRNRALSRNGQMTASLDYTSSAEPRLGTIVRQNRRHRRPWIVISTCFPLLTRQEVALAASLFYGATAIGCRIGLRHRRNQE